jgi:hypothetical protein
MLQTMMDHNNNVFEASSSFCCWASTMLFTVGRYCQLVFIFCRCCSRSTAVMCGIPIWDSCGKVMCSRPESMAIDSSAKT